MISNTGTLFIESKRLQVMHPSLADADKAYMLDTDPDIMQYQTILTHQASYKKFMKSLRHYEQYGFSFGIVYEKETGEFIGQSGMIYRNYDHQQSEVHLGMRLLKAYWNKGYATELLMARIAWGFQHLAIDKLISLTDPDNGKMRGLLEKCGLHHVEIVNHNGRLRCRYEICRNIEK